MKNMFQLQSVSDIKGMHSIGARSIPKAMRSNYLELYVLDRERARMEKEKFSLDKRRRAVQRRLDGLSIRMDKIKKQIRGEELKAVRNNGEGKPMKKMKIKY